jgi:hypothetical protein
VQGDLNTIWRELESLERRIAAPAPHDAHHGPDWFDDWRARMDRVLRVRSALSQSGPVAHRLLAERLSGIDLSVVGEILLSACKDIALVWGASVLLGGAAGALIGFFGFGVGALPGAAAGAAFGTQAGAWVLGFLGLKALTEDLGTAIPDALRHYELGFKLAWGPVRRWEQDEGTHRAPYELAEGHLVLMMAMLSALMAYLTRGRGDPGAKARILQEIRQSPRLGPKVADWVVANEDKLTRHPSLKPKGQQVQMSAGKPPVDAPITPSQMRPAAGKGGDGGGTPPPPPKKPDGPGGPKRMPQKTVRCFEPNDLPNNKYQEFDRQLEGQQNGLNEMSVDEYLKGRDAFTNKDVIRDPSIARQARADLQAAMQKDLERELMSGGAAPRAAKEQAAQLAKDKMKTLAALHNPDMVSAGKDTISDFGDRNINSRIGAQWKSRVSDLDDAAKNIPQAERAATKMNAKLQRCP